MGQMGGMGQMGQMGHMNANGMPVQVVQVVGAPAAQVATAGPQPEQRVAAHQDHGVLNGILQAGGIGSSTRHGAADVGLGSGIGAPSPVQATGGRWRAQSSRPKKYPSMAMDRSGGASSLASPGAAALGGQAGGVRQEQTLVQARPDKRSLVPPKSMKKLDIRKIKQDLVSGTVDVASPGSLQSPARNNGKPVNANGTMLMVKPEPQKGVPRPLAVSSPGVHLVDELGALGSPIVPPEFRLPEEVDGEGDRTAAPQHSPAASDARAAPASVGSASAGVSADHANLDGTWAGLVDQRRPPTAEENEDRPLPVGRFTLAEGYELEFNSTPVTLDQANGMPPSALESVFDVAVMRPGFGRITFLGPTDLRGGLDFARLVFIGEKLVRVYPEEYEDKPERGQGLNKPSLVEMYGFRVRNRHGEVVTSQEKADKFLRKHAAARGVEHLSYDVDSGIYKFKTFHWSEYVLGLVHVLCPMVVQRLGSKKRVVSVCVCVCAGKGSAV